jgi:bifunctional non-homologous end joining protein LigD
MRCDISVRDGKIATLGDCLDDDAETIDATDKLILPGGVNAHYHFDQPTTDAPAAPAVSRAARAPPPAVNQLHLEKRKGGTGTRLWVEDLGGLLGSVEIGLSRSTHGARP